MRETWVCDTEPNLDLIAECVRPASKATLITSMAYLAQYKPLFQTDDNNSKIIIKGHAEELDGVSELAVHDAIAKLKAAPGRYFPEPHEIYKAFRESDEWIKNVDSILKAERSQ